MDKELVHGVSVENPIASAAGGSTSGRAALVHDRLAIDELDTAGCPEESLVIDDRCDQSPAALVESKLTRMLGGSVLPVSHLQTRGLLRHRC
jgi:hypothetical protein